MEAALLKEQVRQFIVKIAARRGVESISDDDSLTGAGVLDSMAIFRLVSFLEENFSVAISDDEITADNFKSINAIQDFVTVKLSANE